MHDEQIRMTMAYLEQRAALTSAAYSALAALLPTRDATPLAQPDDRAPAVAAAPSTPPPPINAKKVPTVPKAPPAPKRVAALAIGGGARPAGAAKDDQMIEAIATAKGLTATAAAEQLGVTLGSAWTRLKRLVEEGRLTCGKDKVYRRVVTTDAEQVA